MCVLGNNAYRLSTDGTNISGWHWLNLVTTSPAKVTGNYDLCVENHLKIVFISGRWIIVIQPDDSKKTWMPRLYVCTCIYIYICTYMYTVYTCIQYISWKQRCERLRFGQSPFATFLHESTHPEKKIWLHLSLQHCISHRQTPRTKFPTQN